MEEIIGKAKLSIRKDMAVNLPLVVTRREPAVPCLLSMEQMPYHHRAMV